MRKGDGMPDALSEHYADLLEGSYDCVDRLVLNAYFRMGHSGGGFRTWWQKLYGSEEHLDNAHLMRLAGRFGRRLRAFAKARNIPVVDCKRGERKHEIAEEYLARHTGKPGLFLILVSKAQARFGRSAASATWSGRSRCPTSTTTRFTSGILSGGTSPLKSPGILLFRRK